MGVPASPSDVQPALIEAHLGCDRGGAPQERGRVRLHLQRNSREGIPALFGQEIRGMDRALDDHGPQTVCSEDLVERGKAKKRQ